MPTTKCHTHLGVSLYFEVVVTEVALHAELEDWSGVVVAHCGLLCIVADTHANMGATPSTPDVVRQLKPAEGRGKGKRKSLNGLIRAVSLGIANTAAVCLFLCVLGSLAILRNSA